MVLCGLYTYSHSDSDLGRVSVVGWRMNLFTMAMFLLGFAVYLAAVYAGTLYRFLIEDLGSKAALYEEQTERLMGLDSVEWW